MNMFKRCMRGLSLMVIVSFAFMATACTTVTPAQGPATPTVGGSYGVYHFGGLPARNGYEAVAPAQWTDTEWLDLQDLQKDCRTQMDPQIPGMANQILLPSFKLGLSTGVFGALGTGFGAVSAFTGVSFADYAKYGGLAGMGSAFGSGLVSYADRYNQARNYVYYACQQFAVGEARRSGRLKGIGVIPWAGTGQMKPVARPTGTPSRGDGQEDSVTDANPPAAPVPPM